MPGLQTTYFHLPAQHSSHFTTIAGNISPLVKIKTMIKEKSRPPQKHCLHIHFHQSSTWHFFLKGKELSSTPSPDNEQLLYPQTNESSDKLAIILDWPEAPRKTRVH